jgi:hypothetical protein
MEKQKKVTVDLVGGIGNQLFCYSAGRYLSSKLNVSLSCNVTKSLDSISREKNYLEYLELPGKFYEDKKARLKMLKFLNLLGKIFGPYHSLRDTFMGSHYYSQKVGFDPGLDSIGKSLHIHGYFQSWKYPEKIREEILEKLNKKAGMSEYAILIADRIIKENGVVVHIRLGDYLNPENKYFGVLSSNYYKNALDTISIQNLRAFIFSDDITLAKEKYSEAFPEDAVWVGAENSIGDIESLAVMTNGSGFIIANSTFSWWAAFLSQRGQFVIAPSKWFRENEDPVDLIPASWRREESIWND